MLPAVSAVYRTGTASGQERWKEDHTATLIQKKRIIVEWNTAFYDRQHHFVTKYGEGLIAVLQPKQGERILDLGSGTGSLAYQMAQTGAAVTGMDSSPEMVKVAAGKYPSVTFLRGDACSFKLEERFDAVFSNAVLHWIFEHDAMLGHVYDHLKPGGRFVAEFGAKDNIKLILAAVRKVLRKHGYEDRASQDRWYFPSLGAYAAKLEEHGFQIRFMEAFDRPTFLEDRKNGIVDWLEMFGKDYFTGLADAERYSLLREIQDQVSGTLYQDGKWIADYRRLRFYAAKA